MIAAFDFVPEYCPNCGRKLGPWDRYGLDDLLNYHCAHTCQGCGMHFVALSTGALIKAADAEDSDLSRNL